MFSGCRKITTLDFSNFNTDNVTNTNTMFFSCDAITSLDLSNFKLEKVTDMSSMFSFCEEMTTIYCNHTWKAEQSENMFATALNSRAQWNTTNSRWTLKWQTQKQDISQRKNPSGISQSDVATDATVVAIYSLDGKKLTELQSGVNIVRMSDGTTHKVMK